MTLEFHLGEDMKLKSVIANVLKENEENITDSASTKTLKSWSSLKHVDLILAIERTYAVKFSTAEIVRLQSFKDIVAALTKRGVAFEH